MRNTEHDIFDGESGEFCPECSGPMYVSKQNEDIVYCTECMTIIIDARVEVVGDDWPPNEQYYLCPFCNSMTLEKIDKNDNLLRCINCDNLFTKQFCRPYTNEEIYNNGIPIFEIDLHDCDCGHMFADHEYHFKENGNMIIEKCKKCEE